MSETKHSINEYPYRKEGRTTKKGRVKKIYGKYKKKKKKAQHDDSGGVGRLQVYFN